MFSKNFAKQVLERAVKSAAQALIGLWVGAKAFDVWDVDWKLAGGVALGGAVLSVLFSIVTAGVGEPDSPSAVKIET